MQDESPNENPRLRRGRALKRAKEVRRREGHLGERFAQAAKDRVARKGPVMGVRHGEQDPCTRFEYEQRVLVRDVGLPLVGERRRRGVRSHAQRAGDAAGGQRLEPEGSVT